MPARRRCVHCDTDNEPEQIYCVRCGKYLSEKKVHVADTVTVWNIGASAAPMRPAAHPVQGAGNVGAVLGKPQYVVICPDCGEEMPTSGGTIPLACRLCNYMFQAGIDMPVLKNKGVGDSGNAPVGDYGNGDALSGSRSNGTAGGGSGNGTAGGGSGGNNAKKGPLPRGAGRDTTSMRLIMLSRRNIPPCHVNEGGDILGLNGTVLNGIKTNQQISIWHSITGWYMRVMAGSPLHNGCGVNVGMQIKLSDGDILTLEKEQIRVEIL